MKTVLLALTFILPAHSWYPKSCCGDNDCKPVPCDQLVEEPNGYWKYLPSGNEFLPSMIQPSYDRHCHICIGAQKQSLCAFIQQGV